MDDAVAWILKNHPEEYVGMSAENNVGDFQFSAIIQAHSDDLSWATREGRERITKEYAKKHNLEVGTFDYTKFDEVVNAKHDDIVQDLTAQGLILKEHVDTSLCMKPVKKEQPVKRGLVLSDSEVENPNMELS